MADSVANVKKPVLRGLLHSQIKRNLGAAIVLSIVSGIALKYLVNEPRKAQYAEFYKTYDIEKEFNEMRNKGVFDSCKPN
ncbi:PREDICTED: cytochrome c oxidase subunit 6C-1 [Nicrophorus vespilloides]|uniref:Cytochrome c oxidase subunit 6C-1 n=1 Tax=Nicrophorus vespilloides TaxID=110193 RepID=A0ABM1MAG8_NICVS|nr:PREDICTED: cytochrome c oxidase subunit 6C-1 [Nicrophorus vespilloides]XP_017771570.1 PREDICTED: cytochrome c oxidase subunit 6C-1 [Nicrophorus vespilloides]